jgi:hypothetical protein
MGMIPSSRLDISIYSLLLLLFIFLNLLYTYIQLYTYIYIWGSFKNPAALLYTYIPIIHTYFMGMYI